MPLFVFYLWADPRIELCRGDRCGIDPGRRLQAFYINNGVQVLIEHNVHCPMEKIFIIILAMCLTIALVPRRFRHYKSWPFHQDFWAALMVAFEYENPQLRRGDC